MRTAELATQIDQLLRTNGSADRAEHERAYLKSNLEHYGTSVPKIRAAVRSVATTSDLTRPTLLETVDDLWARGIHECRMAAVELLICRLDVVEAGDLDLIERLLRDARTWAIVDTLATKVVAALLERDAATVGARLDQWAQDDDFWLRRTALLAHLPSLRSGGGDFERFSRYADGMLGEREFFIRKAIGWVLRDTGRRRPADVTTWLVQRRHRVSGLTLREAVKWLPEEDRSRLLG